MTRAVLYARFSSDLQSAASIPDQHRALRTALQRLGFREIGAFGDAAISGASLARPQLEAALAEIEAGRAEVLFAESLDRVSRDLEHVARIAKRVAFAGARIVTLSEGEISEIHLGLSGALSAMYLRQLAEKTRRGQAGVVASGRIAGGRAYGYRTAGRGEFEIDEAEAEIVRRICREYAAGRSPRVIAKELNAEGVPSPRGREWAANTIIGNRARGTGIVNNPLYRGRIVWNRLRWRKDPVTGKRRPVENSTEDRIETEREDLRIIDEALAAEIAARQGDLARRPAQRRPTRPLSGLIVCGVCGSRMTITGRDFYGCPGFRERGTCTNNRQGKAAQIEARVLDGLKRHLCAPDAAAAYARAYAEERKRLRAAQAAAERKLATDLAEAEKALANLMSAIAGAPSPAAAAAIASTMGDAAERVEQLRAEAARIPPEPDVVDLARTSPAMIARNLEMLWETLAGDPKEAGEARDALALLIDRIRFIPGENRGEWSLQIVGDLAALLDLASGGSSKKALVAGAGFEPATFRL